MPRFRVQVDLHHNPDDADGRVWMLVFNGWQVWRLTDAEMREHSADVLLKLAEVRGDMAEPVDAGVPYAEANPW